MDLSILDFRFPWFSASRLRFWIKGAVTQVPSIQNRQSKIQNRLAFRELEAFTRALLAVLLALFGARVAGDEACAFQARAEFGVELHQRPRHAVAHGAGLTGLAA